jgi:hypothetical protein
MKYSEAILIGSQFRPQGFGGYGPGYCANQGAMKAMNLNHYSGLPGALVELDCPACEQRQRDILASVVTHLNDDHRWSREKIAEWVARVEPAEVGQ